MLTTRDLQKTTSELQGNANERRIGFCQSGGEIDSIDAQIRTQYPASKWIIMKTRNSTLAYPFTQVKWAYQCKWFGTARDTIRWYKKSIAVNGNDNDNDNDVDKKCFVATATYIPANRQIPIEFYVLKSMLPCVLVKVYYRASPLLTRIPRLARICLCEGIRAIL